MITTCLSAQQDRIRGAIRNDQTVVLSGHVPPQVRPEYDQGPVEPSFSMPAITLYLKPSASQQSDLERLTAEQQDPSSPNYHHWLSPEEYAGRYGVGQNDLDKISAWLASQGFRVEGVARSRTWILFSGTAGQVQDALRTEIHRYVVNGEAHYANANDPAVPASLATLVRSFRGLHDFRLKARSIRGPVPEMTTPAGNHHMAPDDFVVIYDVMPLYQAGIDGTGQKLAIVGQTDINVSDVTFFRNRYNLPALSPQKILVPGHSNPGISQNDLPEADLDLEWSGAVARNATILYVYSDDVFTSVTHVIDQDLAPVVSMSYGLCEQGDLVDLPTFRSLAQQANAQGMTWLAASGDSGAADCEDAGASTAQNGLAVDSPASIPEVTGMGGTEFMDQEGSYWSLTNTANDASALSYIPERAWNDTSLGGGLGAGGGGVSIFFPRPVWQTGPGVPNDGFRHVPDLSLSASPDRDGYLVYSHGVTQIYGGTSVAAPTMAGIVALLNQYLQSKGHQSQPGVGNINPMLYRLAGQNAGVFHDVTQGSNAVPCVIGSPNCRTGSLGYSAGPAYDQATGLGSPDANNLIQAWTNSQYQAAGSAVVPSIDQNPVFEQPPDAHGNRWVFTLTLNEEAGVGTTLTGFTINGQPYGVAKYFAGGTIPANGSISATVGFPTLAVPASLVFGFNGVDASGRAWSQQLTVPFNGPQVSLVVGGASNAASGQQAYAPGMLLSVYGTALGDFAQSAGTLPLPDYLAGFEASFSVNGSPVSTPLYYVSHNQVNIQIPYETPLGDQTLTVGNPYVNVNYTLHITQAAPGIFMTNGFVSAPFSSAGRGQVSTLFITGDGQVSPSLPTGTSPSPGTLTSRLPKPTLPVTVTVGGKQAAIQFIGIPTGLVGVTQINYTVPSDTTLGVQQVVVEVGTTSSPPAKLTVTQ